MGCIQRERKLKYVIKKHNCNNTIILKVHSKLVRKMRLGRHRSLDACYLLFHECCSRCRFQPYGFVEQI